MMEENEHNPGDLELHEHDQLPNVEEYKASIGHNGSKKQEASPSKPDPDGHDGIFLTNDHAGEPFMIDDMEEGDEIIQEDYHEIPRLGQFKKSQARLPWSRGCWKFCCLMSFLLLVAVTLGLLLTSPEEEKEFWHFIQGDTNGYRAVRNYVTDVAKLTDPDIFNGLESPQYFAAQWLAHGDSLAMEVPVNEDSQYSQRYAMAVLYFSLNGPEWNHNYNFLSPDHVCAWYQEFEVISGADQDLDQEFKLYGVHECKPEDGKLVAHAIYLPANGLNGTIPAEIKALGQLESLEIEANDGLTGNLPSILSEMTSLKHLMLQFCNLEGKIPTWIGKLTNLESLGLGGNALTGTVPTELGSLTRLNLLGLDRNQLYGNIDVFGPISNLRSLYIDSNYISGSITAAWMGNFPLLEELDLSDNVISGQLPSDFFDLSNRVNLQVVDLHGNQLVGDIPTPATENTVMTFLSLHENKFENAVPDLVKLRALRHVDLSSNRLTGKLPQSMGLMSNLEYLFAGTNSFDQGRIPFWLLELTNLRELSLKESQLTGVIPATIFTYLTKLQFLDFHLNSLTGQVPEDVSKLTDLRHLLLKMNKLNGNIPETISQMTNLEVFLIEQNGFSGDTDPICSSPDMNIQAFVSDCGDDPPSIVCTCCTTCCSVADALCNTFEFNWKANLDPVSHYGYRRQRYNYDTEMTIVP
ncbi:unnamed protein product [Cylindrotheca closterium]|uniref:L domain-like protein n=1 Tax=Cylindrotheca closterium TaxID=2856 RepID=A0AAD2G0U9_9STRA|nr:unnamed protein product [Cylindrotheca closterium]